MYVVHDEAWMSALQHAEPSDSDDLASRSIVTAEGFQSHIVKRILELNSVAVDNGVSLKLITDCSNAHFSQVLPPCDGETPWVSAHCDLGCWI